MELNARIRTFAPPALGAALLALWSAARFGDLGFAREVLGYLVETAGETREEEEEARHQSYYEALLEAPGEGAWTNLLGGDGGAVEFKRRAELEVRNHRGGTIGEMRADAEIALHGHALRTNSRGMPDRERSLEPSPGLPRLAFVGESWTAGWGVEETARYPTRFEARLAREGRPRVEVLNFSVPGNSPVLQAMRLPGSVLPFAPDAVLLVAPPADARRVVLDAARMLHEGVELPSETLRSFAARAGARAGRTVRSLYRRLSPLAEPLLVESIREAVRQCGEAGSGFAVVLLPPLQPSDQAEGERRTLLAACTEARAQVLDLTEAFAGEDPSGLLVASFDLHPNARGHALLERALARALARSPDLLARLGLRAEDLDG